VTKRHPLQVVHVAQPAQAIKLARFQLGQLARAAEGFAKVRMPDGHIISDPAHPAADRHSPGAGFGLLVFDEVGIFAFIYLPSVFHSSPRAPRFSLLSRRSKILRT